MASTVRARRSTPRRLVAGLLLSALVVIPAPATASTRPAGSMIEPALSAPAPLRASQLARRLSGEVYGYLPYWEIDSGTDAYLRYDLLTDIALFSVGFSASGTIGTSTAGYKAVTGATAGTITAHAHAAGVRVDLTVTSFGYEKNAAFFSNPAAMAAAATNISNVAKAKGYDGVNLDVELLENPYFAAYGTFVGQIRTALRTWNPDARVSVAVNGSVSGTGMANQALANGADRIFIMGYSYRSSGSSPAGSISPIVRPDDAKSLTWTLDLFASKGIPANRIHLGLPYYGRSWYTTSDTLNAPATSSAGVFIPSDDLGSVPAGTVIHHDPVEGTKWFAVKGASGWVQTYFDDGTTLRAKYALANQRGLAGVGIWTLGYDRGVAGYWEAIIAAFGTVRVAGADRYATAAAIARDSFAPGVDVAYVATGAAFPDALAAAAAAGAAGAPVLLVTRDTVPASTISAIGRLHPDRIVVVGGKGAVSDAVLAQLASMAPSGATRSAGADRYATAAALSAATYPSGAAVAYVASGAGFADAVSAAPAAARDGAPILLTRPDAAPEALLDELVRLAPDRIVIVGGVGAISLAVTAAIREAVPGVPLSRLEGKDRYGTSAAVAATFESNVAAVYVATGLAFPDALAAAAAAGTHGGPLLITPPTTLPAGVGEQIDRLDPSRAVVAGGTAAVADSVLVAVRSAVAR